MTENMYPHEVLMDEKKVKFEELTDDIKEAIEDFDNLYQEVEIEEKEASEKGETFELDEPHRKKLLRFSEQAATMIYGYLDEKKEAADKEAADKEAADKEAADKLEADKLAADKLAADKLAADKLEADKLAADKLAADKLAADKLAADKGKNPEKKKGHAQVGGFRFNV